jgi:hypothetical protein
MFVSAYFSYQLARKLGSPKQGMICEKGCGGLRPPQGGNAPLTPTYPYFYTTTENF